MLSYLNIPINVNNNTLLNNKKDECFVCFGNIYCSCNKYTTSCCLKNAHKKCVKDWYKRNKNRINECIYCGCELL